MENPLQQNDSGQENSDSRKTLLLFFSESLKELYFAEIAISEAFHEISGKISAPQLKTILNNHYQIHLNHKERLAKIFKMQDELVETKNNAAIIALLNDANEHFTVFSDDIVNWEIALLLTSRKLAHYKIAAYGAAAHLAINLNNHRAATLLAIDVQEEEDFVNNHLNDITHQFLGPYR